MEQLLLGLDLGTTSCKAAVVTHGGREVSHGRARVPWERVATGAEIAPERLVEAALAAASEALDGAPDGAIGALGVEQAVKALKGEPTEPEIGTESVSITKDNLADNQDALYKSSC